MKKGYYIHFEAKRTLGVAKKIDMQISEFSKIYEMHEIEIHSEDVNIMKRFMRFLPGGAIERTYEKGLSQISNPDFVYIRRTTADKAYISFLKEIKRKWPKCKMIVEIFTYPYDRDEFKRLLTWPYYFKEIYNRKKLTGIVDRYVTYSEDEKIFGIPTIRTGNGIIVEHVKIPKIEEHEELRLIAVAHMQKHHGYERLIKGMRDYCKKPNVRKVHCILVGDGPEKNKYVNMVQRYDLQKYITFFGTTVGAELDLLYEKAEIAVSALGLYKDKVDREASLKSRECLAKGFPMVTGCKVDVIKEEYPYVCEFPNDKSPIDIEKVVSFYENLLKKQTRAEIQHSIRNFAKETVDMSVMLRPIVKYIECK